APEARGLVLAPWPWSLPGHRARRRPGGRARRLAAHASAIRATPPAKASHDPRSTEPSADPDAAGGLAAAVGAGRRCPAAAARSRTAAIAAATIGVPGAGTGS